MSTADTGSDGWKDVRPEPPAAQAIAFGVPLGATLSVKRGGPPSDWSWGFQLAGRQAVAIVDVLRSSGLGQGPQRATAWRPAHTDATRTSPTSSLDASAGDLRASRGRAR